MPPACDATAPATLRHPPRSGRTSPSAPHGRRLPPSGEGSRSEAFGAVEWSLLATNALIWGSSYLWIELGLQSFGPGIVALARVLLGIATLAFFRRARTRVERQDLPRIALLGVVWVGLPMILFPLAQQRIDSSLAGMISGAVPLFAAAWSVVLLRRWPARRQTTGLLVGLAGIVAISAPQIASSRSTTLGIALVVLATVLYGLASNLAVPLQQRYGALPVLLRAQLAALVVIAPYAAANLRGSSWSWTSGLAMLPLGVLGTGVAYVLMTTLVGRAGATRGSIAVYFIPVVAAALGVGILGEPLPLSSLAGTGLILAGAWLTSRADPRAAPPPAARRS